MGDITVISQEPVGRFKFGDNTVEADKTGVFKIHFSTGGDWYFDLGEITLLSQIVLRIASGQITPSEEEPEVFWRTNGAKVIEVWYTSEYIKRIHLREGGTKEAYFWVSEAEQFLRHLGVLTEGAPYHRIARLLEIVEKEKEERLIRVERFPLNNRQSKTPMKIEKEFTQEIIKSISVETTFGIGLDYWIAVNLETRFGLTHEQRISEAVKVSMEATPGEHIEYLISWKEVTTSGDAIFEINGVKEKIPFKLKSGLIPEVRYELVARD